MEKTRVENRREEIVEYLTKAQSPVSGGALSKRFGVSRQIVVQDIASLKAEGYDIRSTHYGYVLHGTPFFERIFKVRHTAEETERELTRIVELGGTVADVFVWHKAYGKISAKLHISSKLRVEQFMESVRTGKSTELMHVTGGYHYHTVTAASEEILDGIERALREENFIVAGD